MNFTEEPFLSSISPDESEAFDSLFESNYARLCNYAYSMVNSFDLAEDLVQDVFVNIWIRRKKIAIQSTINAYLYKCVYNACLDHQKKNRLQQIFVKSRQDGNALSMHDSIKDFELPERIDRAIEELPEQCRKIFKMSRQKGFKYHEIAKELNISENTVDTQIRRALKRLREQLKDYLVTITVFFIFLVKIYMGIFCYIFFFEC